MVCTAVEFDHQDVRSVVVFADMAGFTTYTEAHGDHRAAQLAGAFADIAASVLGPGDEIVKTIGDAVMVTCATTAAAVDFLGRLRRETSRISGFPLLRAGMSEGPLVKQRGDVFGATVNTAARLVGVAGPGQVIADYAAVSAAEPIGSLRTAPLGSLRLHNINLPVQAYLVEIES
ncbi:adenylate cyclase [Mycolicibacterium cosmeticum]|nr:adenylate/guanylate cyclase domain-containing protein [Mycolicibacterium goodii]MBU8840460.1 adenylate/guanylate cyclase domain-containing protein [Mycolicibacterium goodii]TLH71948.1 adenylate cyclase [Mycolicibacterium cosmeticum]